jgi:hypothetical protein
LNYALKSQHEVASSQTVTDTRKTWNPASPKAPFAALKTADPDCMRKERMVISIARMGIVRV